MGLKTSRGWSYEAHWTVRAVAVLGRDERKLEGKWRMGSTLGVLRSCHPEHIFTYESGEMVRGNIEIKVLEEISRDNVQGEKKVETKDLTSVQVEFFSQGLALRLTLPVILPTKHEVGSTILQIRKTVVQLD